MGKVLGIHQAGVADNGWNGYPPAARREVTGHNGPAVAGGGTAVVPATGERPRGMTGQWPVAGDAQYPRPAWRDGPPDRPRSEVGRPRPRGSGRAVAAGGHHQVPQRADGVSLPSPACLAASVAREQAQKEL